MEESSSAQGKMLRGTVFGCCAEALALPTGLLIAALLTRRLSPKGYGLFALATPLVVWIEWAILPIVSHATIKFVSESEEWQEVGTAALRLHLLAGCLGMLVVWLLAAPVATMLNEPALAGYLYLYALDIPLFTLVHAHRSVLVGTGGFNARALASSAHSIAKLLCVALLVECGFSVSGALVGYGASSLVELVVIRLYVRPALLARCGFPLRRFLGYATPLFLSTLSLSICDKLDLFMLKRLSGVVELAGIYGAAQALAVAPSIVSVALAPLLLSSQSRMLSTAQVQQASDVGREVMRAVIWLIPMAAIAAGAAPEIIDWIYGAAFASSAPLFAVLLFGQVARVLLIMATTSLVATGKPRWVFLLSCPLLLLAFMGHLIMIPRLGALGASLVTAAVSALGALGGVAAVWRCLRTLPPAATVVRSLVLAGCAYIAAASWPAPGLLLLVKLPILGLGIVLLLFLLGEFNPADLKLARGMLGWRLTAPHNSPGL